MTTNDICVTECAASSSAVDNTHELVSVIGCSIVVVVVVVVVVVEVVGSSNVTETLTHTCT